MTYRVYLNVFEGPLDLLLYLIKKNDVDILDIPIAEITDQYLKYIETMTMLNLDVVGDFLVMAATLLQIKSKMLLPQDETVEDEPTEDPREELVRRLMEYKLYKEVSLRLQQQEERRRDLFSRRLPFEETASWEEAKEVVFEATLFDLVTAFQAALNRLKEKKTYDVALEVYTVEDKIHDLLHRLVHTERLLFDEVFIACRSRDEAVVTFLALLELIRLKEVVVVQQTLFGPIEIRRNTERMLRSREDDPASPPPD